MITKQQKLEWLANNLEKWKSGYDYAVVEKATDGYLYVRWPSVCASGITKKEWQQERDKMQKKEHQKAIDEMASVILDYDGYMITSATAELVARQLHYAGYHK